MKDSHVISVILRHEKSLSSERTLKMPYENELFCFCSHCIIVYITNCLVLRKYIFGSIHKHNSSSNNFKDSLDLTFFFKPFSKAIKKL